MPVLTKVDAPSRIDPSKVYPLAGFISASGLSYSRIRKAAHAGVEIPTFSIGRRKFIDGKSAVEYIRQLAELHRRQQRNADRAIGILP